MASLDEEDEFLYGGDEPPSSAKPLPTPLDEAEMMGVLVLVVVCVCVCGRG